jgi:metallo-beta-lactamase class B
MSTAIRFSFFLLVIFSSAFVTKAQDLAPLPHVDSAWVKPTAPFRIAGSLYYVGTYDLSSYLVATPEGHVLINTGLAESVPMILKSVESLGFKFSDIKMLLVTHAHYDHVAGMAEIKKITGAKMMVHEADAQVLADGGKSDFIFGGPRGFFAGVKADRVLKDGDVLTMGDVKLKVLHHPGHTKGATSFLIDTRDDKRSWKVLIANMPTILSETRIFGMSTYPHVGKDYKYTLESLKKLQFDLWLASHASQFDLHDKHKPGDPYRPEAFADRAAYDALVNKLQQAYDKRLQTDKK